MIACQEPSANNGGGSLDLLEYDTGHRHRTRGNSAADHAVCARTFVKNLSDMILICTADHLEVHPAYRNKGIGTKLVREAERTLVSLGRRQVALGVAVHNTDALRLYYRLGYREWKHSPIATFRKKFLDNGEVIQVVEICRVLTKTISPPEAHESIG